MLFRSLFIARRIVILAAEDIGMADPQALVVAQSAASALQFIGMPEGQLILAEAVIYMATAPKSNSCYLAVDSALEDIRRGQMGSVPKHLKDAHYSGAKKLGYGEGYRYPHDFPDGYVKQQYLPDLVKDRVYYQPSERDIRVKKGGESR